MKRKAIEKELPPFQCKDAFYPAGSYGHLPNSNKAFVCSGCGVRTWAGDGTYCNSCIKSGLFSEEIAEELKKFNENDLD